MKFKLTSIFASLVLAVSTPSLLSADLPAAGKTSAEFEKLKTLVGTWKGKADMGQGPVDFTAQYRVIAAGSVLEERSFAGTPNEMVTMFFVNKDGKVALTHYCMMGNRPAMTLASVDSNTFRFALDEGCGIECAKESHMNALTLRFDDANTITAGCTAIIDGKPAPDHTTTLKRVSATTGTASK